MDSIQTEQNNVLSFTAEISGDVVSGNFPVYEDYTKSFIGSFSVENGNTIIGFVDKTVNFIKFKLDSNEDLYFTPLYDGKERFFRPVCGGFISDAVINGTSVKIKIQK